MPGIINRNIRFLCISLRNHPNTFKYVSNYVTCHNKQETTKFEDNPMSDITLCDEIKIQRDFNDA